jgi:hypothetical protein
MKDVLKFKQISNMKIISIKESIVLKKGDAKSSGSNEMVSGILTA